MEQIKCNNCSKYFPKSDFVKCMACFMCFHDVCVGLQKISAPHVGWVCQDCSNPVTSCDLKVVGIPLLPDENLIAIMVKLASLCDYNLMPDTDIDYIGRMAPTTAGRSYPYDRPIHVKLNCKFKRNDFLLYIRRRGVVTTSDLGFPGQPKPLFIFA